MGTSAPHVYSPILHELPRAFPRAAGLAKGDPELIDQCARLQAAARRFSDEHVRPYAADWDRRAGDDHTFVAWEAIRGALPYRFLSAVIPRAFGGLGQRLPAVAFMMEELCAADAGIANIFGAHNLGIVPLIYSLELDWFYRHLAEIADGERAGTPVIFALAYTEPEAGSDIEDEVHIHSARLRTVAREVPGGYRVTGRKVFISNGSIARYAWASAITDPSRPVESTIQFVVPTNAAGFSVGRIEHKLGQRLCPAAELVFDDLFVPFSDCLGGKGSPIPLVKHALSMTRGPVGAIAMGIARGAIERALAYLAEKRENGRWRFEAQWVQLALADMIGKLQSGRQLYFDAAMAVESCGFMKALSPRLQDAMAAVPRPLLRASPLRGALSSRLVTGAMRAWLAHAVPERELDFVLGLASLAKQTCSDLAMDICRAAMRILGEDACEPAWGVEKCLRDAKLTQIYEGTNEVNRLHVFRGLFAMEAREP
ncbi:MAG: acyl-CoA/acyl-ACP dehydrogenase [Candidatus Schekmanbacteria bacterium]|nr:acyl-CoA/acyl-ACP dehydrogenase [Candidatus Schekmanbacteria bacterium]